MKQALVFVPPVVASTERRLDLDAFYEAKQMHEDGRYVEAIQRFLDFLDPNLRANYGYADGTKYSIPHGSIIVDIELGKGQFRISSNFLRFPTEHRTPMLRQAVELNSRRLMLARFVKVDDTLRLEYQCPIEQTNPYKLYDLVCNICAVGDLYNEEFVTKFGAERIYIPQIVPYADKEVSRLYDALQKVGRAALEQSRTFVMDRNYNSAWLCISTAWLQFDYFAQPKGELMAKVEEAYNLIHGKLPVSERIQRVSTMLEELLSRSKEDLAPALFYTKTLTSNKRRSSLQNIQENLRDVWNESSDAMQARNYYKVVLHVAYSFYLTYHINDMQRDIDVIMARALSQASERPVEEAAPILHAALERIVRGEIEETISRSERIKQLALGWVKRILRIR